MVARRAEKFAQGALPRAGGTKDQDRAKGLAVGRQNGVFMSHKVTD